MRILLAQNALYFPAHGGGDKSNRLLMEALAARGHQVHVFARTGSYSPDEYRAELATRGVDGAATHGAILFRRAGVDVTVATAPNIRALFTREAREFRPDFILCSTDDPAQLLLEPALRADARVVYLVRATIAVPFGPDCAFPSEPRTARIRECDKVVGVSEYVAAYCREYGQADAIHVPISLMDPIDPPLLGSPTNEFVTLVNPCAVKGISIFLELADALPNVRFAAVPTWGTDAKDRIELEKRSNVTMLDAVDDIDRLLARTSVLLIPSLWAEARSRMVMEGMLRGIPVIASNTGGLSEAKLGVPYTLPVNAVVHYRQTVDDRMVPIADIPPQNIGPWRETLIQLLTDPIHYAEISRQSRAAALAYLQTLTAEPFEQLLIRLPPKKAAVSTPAPAPSPPPNLSPEKKKLLALRLRQRAPASSWFPEVDAAEDERRFWFPHAGAIRGNASQSWIGVVLPGRGARLAEAPFASMEPLIQALAAAIEPYLARPFIFFGHSLGAITAFELARELRRRSLPLPRLLIASSARAPQFRRPSIYRPLPEPTDEELLRQVELPDDPGVRRAFLPSLRADTSLYRRYLYSEEPPFDFSIRAYGGIDDPNVTVSHLEAWREQTTADFAARTFPGGHFYLNDNPSEFITALEEDVS